MRDLIALRAKIDLLISECREDQDNYQAEGELMQTMETVAMIKAYEKVDEMIDEMVGKQLEEMYAQHIQEETEAVRN